MAVIMLNLLHIHVNIFRQICNALQISLLAIPHVLHCRWKSGSVCYLCVCVCIKVCVCVHVWKCLCLSLHKRMLPDKKILKKITNRKSKRSTFWNDNISETMRSSVKMRAMIFTEVDIRHRIASLWMLYSLTTIYIFKVKHLKY